jgi:hypothetical protein
MKAKITSYDPTGISVESQEFDIPIINMEVDTRPNVIGDNGIVYEPAQKNRYLLHIGEYQYWIKKSGQIIATLNY